MFDWFKKSDYSNVIKFPEPKAVPYIQPPESTEKESTTYYSIGHTDDNRVSLKMGYTTLSMTHQGVQNLIDQLELYKQQLQKETDA